MSTLLFTIDQRLSAVIRCLPGLLLSTAAIQKLTVYLGGRDIRFWHVIHDSSNHHSSDQAFFKVQPSDDVVWLGTLLPSLATIRCADYPCTATLSHGPVAGSFARTLATLIFT